MKGLLLKDASTILKETKYFFLFAVVVALVQNDFLFAYLIVYAATLPIAAIGYDERVRWKRLEETLPLTKAQMVGSKYVMGYVSVAVAIVLVLCGRLIGAGLNTNPASFAPEMLFMLLMISCMALIVQAVNLPLMFWIGVERGRLLFVLIVVCTAMAASTIWEEKVQNAIRMDQLQFFLIALLVTVIANLISFQVSKALYSRET